MENKIKNIFVMDKNKGLIPIMQIGLKSNGGFKKGYKIKMLCNGSIILFDKNKNPIGLINSNNFIYGNPIEIYPQFTEYYKTYSAFCTALYKPISEDILIILMDMNLKNNFVSGW